MPSQLNPQADRESDSECYWGRLVRIVDECERVGFTEEERPFYEETRQEALKKRAYWRRRRIVESVIRAPRSRSRSPRRRNVRRARAQARSPGSKDPPESDPPLDVVPLARFRRDVRRWLEGAA